MENIKQFVIDYIEGRISPVTFENALETDPRVSDWLQGLVPQGMLVNERVPETGLYVKVPYTIQKMCRKYEHLDEGGPKGTPAYHFYVHDEIAKLVMNAYPDWCLKPDKALEQNSDLALEVCPEYIDGKEVAENNIIGKILDSIPTDWPKSKRKSEAKKRIKEAFHIEGKTYPRWNQPAEWPVFDGRPMKFLRTEKLNTEAKVHYFIDLQTGSERTVEDYF